MNPSKHHPIPDSTSRRQFLTTSLGILSLPALLELAAAASEKKVVLVPETIGPVLGHIDEQRIFCFVRPNAPGKVTLSVKDQSSKEVARITVEALPENDLCAHFAVSGLKPGTRYRGEFFNEAGTTLFEGCRFDTVTATLPVAT